MPAILRIFLYQTDASLSRVGSTTPYDQGADLLSGRLICEHDKVSTRMYRPIQALSRMMIQTVTGCRTRVGRCIAAGNTW